MTNMPLHGFDATATRLPNNIKGIALVSVTDIDTSAKFLAFLSCIRIARRSAAQNKVNPSWVTRRSSALACQEFD